MRPGTLGEWDGTKWTPADDAIRQHIVDVLIREIAPVMEDHVIRRITREELASAMAACLADPDVNEHAKSLAGYLLGWTERKEAEGR